MRESNQKQTTQTLCTTAVAVALLTVCSWIAIPIGSVPITLQSLAVCLIAALLGAKRAFFAVLAYLLLGFIGVPVFAGFIGGIGKLLSPTGGYLVSFLLVAPLMGRLCQDKQSKMGYTVCIMSIGTCICYAFGTAWWLLLSSSVSAAGVWSALTLCVFPFILPDVCKIILASFLAKKLKDKIK